MAKKIKFNYDTKLFSIKFFSEITNSELDEYKSLESDILVPYRITTNELKRPRFANDALVWLTYGTKKDHDIHLTVHPDCRKYVNFKDIDLSNFQFIRSYLMDKAGTEIRIQSKDNDLMATFFSMQIEGKKEIRLNEVPVPLSKDSEKYDFYKLIDVFNKFSKDLEYFRFYTIKNIFPIRELYEFFMPKVPGGRTEVSFSKDRILISALVGSDIVISVQFNSDKTINLSIDEGKLQRRLTEDKYQLMLDKIFKTKKSGFESVKVELINATNIYTSLTTMFKHLKDGDKYNTY